MYSFQSANSAAGSVFRLLQLSTTELSSTLISSTCLPHSIQSLVARVLVFIIACLSKTFRSFIRSNSRYLSYHFFCSKSERVACLISGFFKRVSRLKVWSYHYWEEHRRVSTTFHPFTGSLTCHGLETLLPSRPITMQTIPRILSLYRPGMEVRYLCIWFIF